MGRAARTAAGVGAHPELRSAGSVGARFLEVAEHHAGRAALVGPSGRRTYAELARTVARAASGIAAAVSDPDAPVAVLAAHDVGLVEAMLAVVVSGRPLAVLDPRAPTQQHLAVLDHIRAGLVVHDPACGGAARALATAMSGVAACELDRLEGQPAPVDRGPDDALLVSCQAGPRGVTSTLTPHRAVLELVRHVGPALDLGPDDRVPLLFGAWLPLWAVPAFVPLLTGSCLVTLDVATVGLVPVPDLLERERITAVHLPPSLVPFLAEASAGRDLPALRAVALGGEPLDDQVVAAAVEGFAPEVVAVGHGTEGGLVSFEVLDAATGPASRAAGPVALGHPVPGVVVSVLADDGSEAARGEVGEVAIGDPPRRTGDLGHLRGEGRLVLVGRVDRRLRLRGRWLDLADVEWALERCEGVAGCAVEGTGKAGHIEVGAMVATDDPEGVDVRWLRAQLLGQFQPEAVPSRWQLVHRLPRLDDGSIDRRAVRLALQLADPASGSEVRSGHVRPGSAGGRGPVAEGVRRPWASVREVLRHRASSWRAGPRAGR